MNRQNIHAIAAFVLLILWPSVSAAHLVNTGLGPFYDGVSHLAMSPDDLLAALALALLAGLSGARAGRHVIFLLPPVWLIGGFLGLQFEQEVSLALFSILWMTPGFREDRVADRALLSPPVRPTRRWGPTPVVRSDSRLRSAGSWG